MPAQVNNLQEEIERLKRLLVEAEKWEADEVRSNIGPQGVHHREAERLRGLLKDLEGRAAPAAAPETLPAPPDEAETPNRTNRMKGANNAA